MQTLTQANYLTQHGTFTKRIANMLARELGPNYGFADVAMLTDLELLRIPNVGKNGFGHIAQVLRANGYGECNICRDAARREGYDRNRPAVHPLDGRKWTPARRAARMRLRSLGLSPQMGPRGPGYKPLVKKDRVVLGYKEIAGRWMFRVRREGIVVAVPIESLTRSDLMAYVSLAAMTHDRRAALRFKAEWLAAPKAQE